MTDHDISIDELLFIINTDYKHWIIWAVPEFNRNEDVFWIPNLMNAKLSIVEVLDAQDSFEEAIFKAFYWIKYYEENSIELTEIDDD